MAQFKSYAQEGNFKQNLQTVPDESKKILERANEQVSARVSVEKFRQKTADLYRRAQEQAGVIEQNARETNFRLEQEAKKAHINAVDRNYKIELANNEVRAEAKARDAAKLQAFSKTAFDFTGAILKKGAEDRKKAATLAAFTHSFDIQTLRDVNQLDNGLTLSQYQQTDLFRRFEKEGKSEAYMQAVYDEVYKHRGSKRWVDNVAILQNHAARYQNRVTAFIDNNPQLTPDELLRELPNVRNDFILEANVGGMRPGAEVLEQHVFPTLRKVDSAVQTSLQQKRSEHRKDMVKADTFKIFDVAAGPLKDNPAAVHEYLSDKPTKESRVLFKEWMINGLRSGTISSEKAQAFLDYKIEHNGQRVPWIDQFGSQPEAGEIVAAIERVRTGEHMQLKEDYEREQAEKKVRLATFINDKLTDDGLASDQDIIEINAMADKVLGVGVTSPALDAVRKLSTDNRAKEIRAKIIEDMIASDTWTVEVADRMKLSFEERTKYGGYATNRTNILKSPQRKQDNEMIDALVDDDRAIAAAIAKDKNNPSHLYMKDYLKRMYDAEVRHQVNVMNVSIPEAQAAAYAKADAYYKNMQKDPTYVDEAGNFKQFQTYLEVGTKLQKRGEARLIELQKLRIRNSPPEQIISIIGKDKVMDAYEQISKPGAVASEQWKQLAEIYGTDPLTMINMLAPIIGKDRIDPSSFELGRLKADMSPLSKQELDQFKDNERTARAFRRMLGGIPAAPRRGGHQPRYAVAVGGGQAPQDDTDALIEISSDLGIDPLDLATIIGYETAGSYSPDQWGGDGDNYMGLIQFGPKERQKYGVVPGMSFRNQLLAVASFLKDRFESVGLSTQGATLEDLYTTVLAGNPLANRNSTDSNGTSPISGVGKMGPHREAAAKRYGLEQL